MTSGLSADLARLALGDLLAVVEDDDAVADAHDDLHVVLDQEHGDAALRGSRRSFREAARLGGREPGRRLVEHQERGLAGQGDGDGQVALLAVRERARLHVAQRPTSGGTPARRRPVAGPRVMLASLRARCARGRATPAARRRACSPIITFS